MDTGHSFTMRTGEQYYYGYAGENVAMDTGEPGTILPCIIGEQRYQGHGGTILPWILSEKSYQGYETQRYYGYEDKDITDAKISHQ